MQLKMILLMGVRDEDLLQKLLTLDATSSLTDFVTCCRSYEATREVASAIHSSPSQVHAVSTYKKNQRQQKKASPTQPTVPPVSAPDSCRSCQRQHGSAKCPAADSKCPNCGFQGHWAKTPRCPATKASCNACSKQGHFAKCCRSTKKPPSSGQDVSSQPDVSSTSPSPKNDNRCRRVDDTSSDRSLKPVNVRLSYGGTSSSLLMLPDTGADITVIGPTHLDALGIPRSNLSPPAITDMLTADGSSMSPALGCFQATL